MVRGKASCSVSEKGGGKFSQSAEEENTSLSSPEVEEQFIPPALASETFRAFVNIFNVCSGGSTHSLILRMGSISSTNTHALFQLALPFSLW